MARRRMRLPNGFGSIVKLQGNRRNPYMARPATQGYKDNGTAISLKPVGYYPTYEAAYQALLEYNQNPWDTANDRLTFAEVYEQMIAHRQANQNRPLSESSYRQYKTSFKHFSSIKDVPFVALRTQQLQRLIEEEAQSRASEEAFINLIKQMYKYAVSMEIVRNDASRGLGVQRAEDDERGCPLSPAELEVFKANSDEKVVRQSLILSFSGFRISALTAPNFIVDPMVGYFKGGVKTAAGKDRVVPIHPGILPFVEDWTPMPQRVYRADLKDFLKQTHLDETHTPHDFRHTFSWLCDSYHVDPLSKKMLMGHSLGTDVTDSRYGHRTFDQLRDEICKIEY